MGLCSWICCYCIIGKFNSIAIKKKITSRLLGSRRERKIGIYEEKQMASRSFKVFGTKKDLESVFYEFQELNLVKYYKCGRNNDKIADITKTNYFGISLNGSHIGNKYLVIKDDESIHFDKYKHISQNLNEASVAIDLGGLYDENTVVPTTISTIWYDNKISKEIFSDLRKIMKRHASTTINGYMILKNAYSKKEQLRFATIGVQSPREYNLIV